MRGAVPDGVVAAEQLTAPVGVAPAAPTGTLEAAARLVSLPVNVVPFRFERQGDGKWSKRPCVKWKGFQDVLQHDQDWDQLDRWLCRWFDHGSDVGIGVITGAISGITVVDVDDDAAAELVERTCGGWPITPRVKTARGWHLWFTHPENARCRTKAGVAPGLDVRCCGGFAAVPPTRRPDGPAYHWDINPFAIWREPASMWPPAEMPQALADLLWPEPSERPASVPVVRATDARAYVTAAFDNELAAVRGALEGTRNDQLNRSVFAVWRFVLSGELDAATVARGFTVAALAAGLGASEIGATIASAAGRTAA